ncbi:carboxymuconolactone decarboxylase family protein [Chitinophagaceae bacterium MMS25-I14]
MEPRINVFEKGGNAMKALYSLGIYLSKSSLEQRLLNLIYFRVSQINGCAYCLDMHAKDLRAEGETEQRLYMMDAWREAIVYTDRERAAFAWAEAVTRINGGQVSEDVYQETRKYFSEEEIVDLTIATITINSYNRINIAFRVPGGSYQPADRNVHAG